MRTLRPNVPPGIFAAEFEVAIIERPGGSDAMLAGRLREGETRWVVLSIDLMPRTVQRDDAEKPNRELPGRSGCVFGEVRQKALA